MKNNNLLIFATLFYLIINVTADAPVTESEGTIVVTRGFSLIGPSALTVFGDDLTGVGDINNDGIDDILVAGAYSWPQENYYPVYAIFGQDNDGFRDIDLRTTSLAETYQGFRIMPSATWLYFGGTLSFAGDLNGDDIDDMIIGASKLSSSYIACIVIFGGRNVRNDIDMSETDLAISGQGYILTANVPNCWGGSVTALDFNNDGISDIIVANWANDQHGYAFVYFGRSSRPNDVDLSLTDLVGSKQGFKITFTSSPSATKLGDSSANIGDINNDDIDDFALGDPNDKGAVYIFFGRTGSFSNIELSTVSLSANKLGFKITGEAAGDNLGKSVSRAGDINNDGIDDLLIGAPGAGSGKGAAYVIFGKNGAFNDINLASTDLSSSLQGFKLIGETGSTLGQSVSGVRDQNDDDIDDILIGAPGIGASYVLFGKTGTFSNLDLGAISLSDFNLGLNMAATNGSAEAFGKALSNAGDFNKDGVDDVVIGSPTAKTAFMMISDAFSFWKQMAAIVAFIYNIIAIICCALVNSSSVVIMVSVMSKLIQAIRYLELPYPFKLKEVLEESNGDLINFNIPEEINRKIVSKQLPALFGRNSVDGSFLNNFWGMIIVLGSLLLAWAFLRVAHYIFLKINKLQGNTISAIIKALYKATLSFFIIQIYGNIGDIIFFTVLQFKSATFETPLSKFSFALCIIFTIIGACLIALHVRFLLKYRYIKKLNTNLSDKVLEHFAEKNDYLKLLHHEFKDTALDKHAFIFILVVLEILVGLMSSTMIDYPLAQSIILVIFSVLLCAYLAVRRPFQEKFDMIGQMFLQVCVVIVFICTLIFAHAVQKDPLPKRNKEEKANLASGIIVVIIIIKIASCLFMGLQLIQEGQKAYQYMKQRKRAKVQGVVEVIVAKKNSNKLSLKTSIDAGSSSINTARSSSNAGVTSPKNLMNLNSARSEQFESPSSKSDINDERGLLGRNASQRSRIFTMRKVEPAVDSHTSLSIKLDQDQDSAREARENRFAQRRRDFSKKSFQDIEKTPKSKFVKVVQNHSPKKIAKDV